MIFCAPGIIQFYQDRQMQGSPRLIQQSSFLKMPLRPLADGMPSTGLYPDRLHWRGQSGLSFKWLRHIGRTNKKAGPVLSGPASR